MNPFKRPVAKAHSPQHKTESTVHTSDTEQTNPSEPRNEGDPTPAGHADPDATEALIEDLSRQVDALTAQVEKLRAERDEAQAAWKHTAADFANAQKRAVSNEHTAREQGIRGVLYNIMPIIDHFDLALGQDPEKVTVQQVISGVTMIKGELLRALASQGVSIINPAPNSAFDPRHHEAVVQQSVEGVEPGNVVATLRMGYAINDRLVRPAQVSVAPAATPPNP